MVKVLITVLVVLVSVAAFCSEDSAANYLNRFFTQDFRAMYEMQDSTMRSVMGVNALAGTYATVKQQFGEVEELLTSSMVPSGDYEVHIFTFRLSGGIFDFIVTTDNQEKVAGFQIRQSSYGMQVPDYADESLFIDQEITVGKEPYYLRGFLTVPTDKESFPLVILVQGSGSHDADVTIGPNKIFRDIAWGLASRGIGVLRYEKRTYRYGAQIVEEGVIPIAEVEYIDDLVIIVEQARTIPGVSDIILAGHSLGGSVVPWVAEEMEVEGIILLAASPKRLAEISLGQNIDLAEEYGISQEVLEQVIELFNMILNHELPEGMVVDPQFGITTDYYYSFDRYLAMPVLKNTDLPVLIINPELDFQVPVSEFNEFEEQLCGRDNVSLVLLSGLNHLFMPVDSLMKTTEQYLVPGIVDISLIETLSGWIESNF